VVPKVAKDALWLTSRSRAQTQALGHRLAAFLGPGDVLCLVGELGAGKTCFVQGLGLGLGVTQPIISPTFVRVREYVGGSSPYSFYHVDLYRMAEGEEAPFWGLEECLYGGGICAIEWADRIQQMLPPQCLWMQFGHAKDPGERTVHCWADGARGQWLLQQVRQVQKSCC
jgi:tRNA threonylcarbamoyladenosine biosynthesis protein TsaE